MERSKRLTILQINDSHAYLELHPGGVLALDNGDTFHGTYSAVASKGEALRLSRC